LLDVTTTRCLVEQKERMGQNEIKQFGAKIFQ